MLACFLNTNRHYQSMELPTAFPSLKATHDWAKRFMILWKSRGKLTLQLITTLQAEWPATVRTLMRKKTGGSPPALKYIRE